MSSYIWPEFNMKQQNMYVLSTMKLPVLFLFLALAFAETTSQSSSQEKVVCAKEDQVSSYTANSFLLKILFYLHICLSEYLT